MTIRSLLVAAAVAIPTIASAADMPAKAPGAPASTWSCGAFERVTKGLLYEGGFFGTREWSTMTFVGCSQPKGGWDFDIIGFVPLKGGVADEVDFEGGYTWVSGNWSLRAGAGYWNVQAVPGSRFQIWDTRIQINYQIDLGKGLALTPWVRLNHQYLDAPSFNDRDFNIGAGGVLKAALGTWGNASIEAAHFYHTKSFGPAQHVTAVTAEMMFDLGTHHGFAVSAGPWGRATWGNILGTPSNHDFNSSFGVRVAAFN